MIRVGHGYDVHRFSRERKLILCGEEIPFEFGLEAHSDGDVAVHALMDALLGAAALGDIGRYFPDNDERYKDISSLKLLAKVMALIGSKGYILSNADITIIAQEPKLMPYVDIMRRNLAETMQTDTDRVSVKATTEEGLGFTGERLGIAAHAVVLIESRAGKVIPV